VKKSHRGYTIEPFPRMQSIVRTIARVARHKYIIRGLVEIDVTGARQLIREHKARTGESLSFTAFLAACVGHAVEMNKRVQAYRNWRHQLILFDDVDINIQVERDLQGQRSSLPLLVRAANRKTVRALHEEIRAAKARTMSSREVKAYMHTWVTLLPSFVQQMLFWVASKSPHLTKQNMSTVELNAIGMFGSRGGWGMHIPFHTLSIVVGGIARKPGVVDERIEIRDYLSMTINFDHDMIDGAPATRFTQQLIDLIESGYGLPDSTEEKEQARAEGASTL
jgi:pyruvate/2-oxoglutarate dehydrogenase complex dihydrolipoamide acyltransferase (E2) component